MDLNSIRRIQEELTDDVKTIKHTLQEIMENMNEIKKTSDKTFKVSQTTEFDENTTNIKTKNNNGNYNKEINNNIHINKREETKDASNLSQKRLKQKRQKSSESDSSDQSDLSKNESTKNEEKDKSSFFKSGTKTNEKSHSRRKKSLFNEKREDGNHSKFTNHAPDGQNEAFERVEPNDPNSSYLSTWNSYMPWLNQTAPSNNQQGMNVYNQDYQETNRRDCTPSDRNHENVYIYLPQNPSMHLNVPYKSQTETNHRHSIPSDIIHENVNVYSTQNSPTSPNVPFKSHVYQGRKRRHSAPSNGNHENVSIYPTQNLLMNPNFLHTIHAHQERNSWLKTTSDRNRENVNVYSSQNPPMSSNVPLTSPFLPANMNVQQKSQLYKENHHDIWYPSVLEQQGRYENETQNHAIPEIRSSSNVSHYNVKILDQNLTGNENYGFQSDHFPYEDAKMLQGKSLLDNNGNNVTRNMAPTEQNVSPGRNPYFNTMYQLQENERVNSLESEKTHNDDQERDLSYLNVSKASRKNNQEYKGFNQAYFNKEKSTKSVQINPNRPWTVEKINEQSGTITVSIPTSAMKNKNYYHERDVTDSNLPKILFENSQKYSDINQLDFNKKRSIKNVKINPNDPWTLEKIDEQAGTITVAIPTSAMTDKDKQLLKKSQNENHPVTQKFDSQSSLTDKKESNLKNSSEFLSLTDGRAWYTRFRSNTPMAAEILEKVMFFEEKIYERQNIHSPNVQSSESLSRESSMGATDSERSSTSNDFIALLPSNNKEKLQHKYI
ncbi:GATA zinc finger domain-containing protein 14-like [Xenia sp. Carnegie-2017]|uniref:GATA zinc finger domain-containing protein 14-like n=1 Tax=Xenia sp. Carnegie-2017 TaxID=2897299 RepID=UPI001F04E135|nr:GATA zinc finger domain-containing protein 14-like [Xenia sp. Carnegie-2017]